MTRRIADRAKQDKRNLSFTQEYIAAGLPGGDTAFESIAEAINHTRARLVRQDIVRSRC